MNTLSSITLAILALMLAAATALAAQSGPSEQGLRLSLSSEIETGWTSNAERRAGGAGDLYLIHNQSLAVAGEAEGIALRGSLAFSETRFMRFDAHDARSAALDLQIEAATRPGTVLRGGFGIGFVEEGQVLPAGPGFVAATTPHLEIRAGLALTHTAGATAVTAGLGYVQRFYGESRFENAAFRPERIRAGHTMIDAHAALRHALSPDLALTAGAAVRHVAVDPGDTALFGRLPAARLRLAGGLASGEPMRGGFALEAGADVLAPLLPGARAGIFPYGKATMALALSQDLSLRLGVETDTALTAPRDGLADFALSGRAGLAYAVRPGLGIAATVFAREERSARFGATIEHSWGGEATLDVALGAQARLGARVSYTEVSGLAPAYEETRLSLILRAAL